MLHKTKKIPQPCYFQGLRYFKIKAPTRFELVIEVLQTFALPLGYGAISNCNHKNISCGLSDSYGNRTRVTAVKGRCLNRLTMGPE